MILPDANVLIYAANRDAADHRPALQWMEIPLSRGEDVRLAWLVVLAFLRVTTHPGILPAPLTVKSAFSAVDAWLNHPSVSIAHPGPEHGTILRRLFEQSGTSGNLASDAHLAALAIEHDAELITFDNDFARFPGLRWRNPLRSPLQ
ncbi:MAG: type II toxin-antitoxin system VapC family toxin [Acidobacteriaceae bacterium]